MQDVLEDRLLHYVIFSDKIFSIKFALEWDKSNHEPNSDNKQDSLINKRFGPWGDDECEGAIDSAVIDSNEYVFKWVSDKS